MLTASGLSVAHGDRVLFRDVTLTLGPGRHVALVGANGTGKTTLLEVVVGERRPDAGTVTRPSTMTIGYLPQDLPGTATGTVLDEVLAGAHEVAELARRLHELPSRLERDAAAGGGDHDRLLAELGDAQARFEQLGGYAVEAEAHRVLAGLGFAPDAADRPVRELSGGWRMRVALARLLLSHPDVLVLDEPTNHLDVDSVAWLEDQLAAWPGALLFVSHDRDFLDHVANRVVELAGGEATEYVGDFADFVVQREERVARAEAMAAQQARKVAEVERFIERFRYKATKARQVQSRIKALQRIEEVPRPSRQQLKARFAFPEPQRSSRVVAELEGVSAGYGGAPVLTGVDLVVERGDRLAFVGPNGAGKTTLLKLLTGELAPLAGRVALGSSVDVAHFSQHQAEVLDPDRTVLEELRTVFGDPAGRNIRTVLGTFGFPGDAADEQVAQLSGGEATRLALCKALCNPVNLLVLDEPTNHLDLPSCDLLEDALRAYPGTILLVTHDRHLIRNVAEALVEVRDGRATLHRGVDERILRPGADADPGPAGAPGRAAPAGAPGRSTPRRGDAPMRGSATEPARGRAGGGGGGRAAGGSAGGAATTPKGGGGAAREARKALARTERRWEQAEAEVARLHARLADPDLYADATAVKEAVAAHETAKDRAAGLMAEWERLAAEVEATG